MGNQSRSIASVGFVCIMFENHRARILTKLFGKYQWQPMIVTDLVPKQPKTIIEESNNRAISVVINTVEGDIFLFLDNAEEPIAKLKEAEVLVLADDMAKYRVNGLSFVHGTVSSHIGL